MEQMITEQILSNEYEFNLCDFALFLSVMKNREAYESTLSIIMDEENLKLKEVKVEQVVLNKSGKRAIRLDAWAVDENDRQFNAEMQNDTSGDDVRKRSRYYQGLIDSPILKSGKETKYKYLPSTVIIFITQEDIFGEDRAMYTFTEQCEEVEGLHLDDGTKKIFLNMSSKKGRPELVSLLQYMKDTRMDNPEICVDDKRIHVINEVVQEVRQSEEWEASKMNILEIGIQMGREEGEKRKLIEQVCKKIRKRKMPEVIAEELDEELSEVMAIYEAAKKMAPKYNVDKIYKILYEATARN